MFDTSDLNPNVIPASPQGGKCIIAWDYRGGGNAVIANDIMTGNGSYDLDFALFAVPEGGSQLGMSSTFSGYPVSNGLLTVTLDFGVSPFAGDALVGNIPTEIVISTLESLGASTGIAPSSLEQALEATQELRRRYAPH